MKQIQFAIIMLAILFLSKPVFSQMYIWTDANGVKHFSDQQPTETKNVSTMNTYKYDKEHDMFIRELRHQEDIRQQEMERQRRGSMMFRESVAAKESNEFKESNKNTAKDLYESELSRLEGLKNKSQRGFDIQQDAKERDRYNQKIFNLKKSYENSTSSAFAAQYGYQTVEEEHNPSTQETLLLNERLRQQEQEQEEEQRLEMERKKTSFIHLNNNGDGYGNNGEVFFKAGNGDLVDKHGTFCTPAAGGYINTQTGEFIPAN